jgi:hypothetical protein
MASRRNREGHFGFLALSPSPHTKASSTAFFLFPLSAIIYFKGMDGLEEAQQHTGTLPKGYETGMMVAMMRTKETDEKN